MFKLPLPPPPDTPLPLLPGIYVAPFQAVTLGREGSLIPDTRNNSTDLLLGEMFYDLFMGKLSFLFCFSWPDEVLTEIFNIEFGHSATGNPALVPGRKSGNSRILKFLFRRTLFLPVYIAGFLLSQWFFSPTYYYNIFIQSNKTIVAETLLLTT